jgi:hypothetical protein
MTTKQIASPRFNLSLRAKQLAAGAVAALAASAANAGALATALEGSVDTAELMLIGGVVMTITGIILLIRSGRKAGGG